MAFVDQILPPLSRTTQSIRYHEHLLWVLKIEAYRKCYFYSMVNDNFVLYVPNILEQVEYDPYGLLPDHPIIALAHTVSQKCATYQTKP